MLSVRVFFVPGAFRFDWLILYLWSIVPVFIPTQVAAANEKVDEKQKEKTEPIPVAAMD